MSAFKLDKIFFILLSSSKRYESENPLLNDRMNNVEVHVVVPKKKTVALKKNTVGSKKKTCDVEVPDSARKLAFGVVSDA